MGESSAAPAGDPTGPADGEVRVARNAAVLAVAEVLGKIGSLVYTVLAARALTTADFGTFAYAVSLSLIVSSIAAWGYDELLIQRTGREPTQLPRLTRGALLGKLSSSLPMFAVVLLVVARGRSSEAVAAIALVLLAAVADLVSDTGRAVATTRERLVGVSSALVVNRIVTATAAVAALLLGGGLLAVSAAYLFGSLVGMAGTVAVVSRLGVALLPDLDLRTVREMARESWAMGAAVVFGLLLFRVDAVLLEALVGTEEVARYTVAYRLVETVLFVAWSVGRASLPVLTRTIDPDRTARLLERSLGALAAVYLPFAAVAIVAAAPVIDLLFGDQYAGVATTSFRLLAFAPLAFAFAYVLNLVLIARGWFVAALVFSVGATVANIGMNLVLIPMYGARGAAAATTISYAVQGFAMLGWLARRRLRVRPGVGWGPAVVATAPLVAALLTGLPLLVALVVGAAGYAVTWFVLARRWTPDEADLVLGLVPVGSIRTRLRART